MTSRVVAVVTATLLAVMVAFSGGLPFFTTNNVSAQMTGNMGNHMLGQNGMMGMGPRMIGMAGMMGMGPGMMGMGPGMMGMGPGMMGMGPGMMTGNQNQSMMMQMMGSGQNVTGSINLFSTISNAIENQVKVSLSEASSTAEGVVGNNSHALAAHIDKTNGYLTYIVCVLGPNMNINRVIVDPGNGQVLLSTPISLQQFMMMGMAPAMMGPGMMGPGMMGRAWE